jgi:hypothetical protein
MDYLKLLQLSALGLKVDFDFNILDLSDKRDFIKRIEAFIATAEIDNKDDVLKYIERKLQSKSSVLYYEQENNIRSIDGNFDPNVLIKNLDYVYNWIDEKIKGYEKIEIEKQTTPRISMPKVWAYVYFYRIKSGNYKMNPIKERFYDEVAEQKIIDRDNFKKEFLSITKTEKQRTVIENYNHLKTAMSQKELKDSPMAFKLAGKDLKIIEEEIKKGKS